MSKCVYFYSSDFISENTLKFQFKTQTDSTVNYIALVPAAVFPTIMLIQNVNLKVDRQLSHEYFISDAIYNVLLI